MPLEEQQRIEPDMSTTHIQTFWQTRPKLHGRPANATSETGMPWMQTSPKT